MLNNKNYNQSNQNSAQLKTVIKKKLMIFVEKITKSYLGH
jgi:hypothetical protein